MAVPDYFGVTDAVKRLTAPAGLEAVHQDGMSWAVQGEDWRRTTRITPDEWNRIIAQFRGLLTIAGVDLSDVPAGSPILLREALIRAIARYVEDNPDAVGPAAALALADDVDFVNAVLAATASPTDQTVGAGATGAATARVVNGGMFINANSNVAGAIRITIPIPVDFSYASVSFTVEIYNDAADQISQLRIGGHFANSNIATPSIQQMAGARPLPVQFGHDGVNYVIQIGDAADTWTRLRVIIRDVSSNMNASAWPALVENAWTIAMSGSDCPNLLATRIDRQGRFNSNGGGVDTSTDLNGLTLSGGFFAKILSTGAPNAPAGGMWHAEFQRHNDAYGTQIAWPGYSQTLAPAIRRVTNSAWSTWRFLAWADEVLPLAGGTLVGSLNGTSASFTGAITRAGNTVLDVGNRPDGSLALAQAGTDETLRTWTAAHIAGAIAALTPAKFKTEYTSALTTITTSATLTFAHGLGVVPKMVHVDLVCQSADLNFAPGDEIDIRYAFSGTTLAAYAAGAARDATNIKMNLRYAIALVDKAAPGTPPDVINTAKWKVRVRAWA